MCTSLRRSFESVATTPIVHVQGMRCVPHVQHAAVWVICENATHSGEAYLREVADNVERSMSRIR
jgi:hypothetical protein